MGALLILVPAVVSLRADLRLREGFVVVVIGGPQKLVLSVNAPLLAMALGICRRAHPAWVREGRGDCGDPGVRHNAWCSVRLHRHSNRWVLGVGSLLELVLHSSRMLRSSCVSITGMRVELACRIILRIAVTSCIASFLSRSMTGVMHYARYDGGVSLLVDEANGVSSVLVGRGVSGDTLISSVRCLAHALNVPVMEVYVVCALFCAFLSGAAVAVPRRSPRRLPCGLHVAQIGLDVEGYRAQVSTLLARIGAVTTSLLTIPILLGAVTSTGNLIASTSKPTNITLYYWKVHQTYSQVCAMRRSRVSLT